MTGGWGDTVIYGPAAPRPGQWLEGQSVVVCDTGPVPARVYTCALVCEHYAGPVTYGQNTTILWEIEVGAGRTTVIYDIDAIGSQVLTLPAQRVRISAKAAKCFWADAPYVLNPATWRLSALVAAGSPGGVVSPATRTFQYDVPGGGIQHHSIPYPARSWRLCGPEISPGNPFVSDTIISLLGTNEAWRGDRLSSAHNDGSWIPLPQESYRWMSIINNSATSISGSVMFAFDI